MPCRAEGSALLATLRRLASVAPDVGGVSVHVVDDGSDPPVAFDALPARTSSFEIVLARHAVNLGQGAALETARQSALEGEHEIFVTMDADGQHDPADLPALVRAIDEGYAAAFGNRFAGRSRVPLGRALVLACARAFESALTLRAVGDAHNGYRAFSRAAIESMAIRHARMAHATEIRLRARALRTIEVPVTIHYSERTLAKGQRSIGAVHVLRDLFLRFLFGSG